MEGFIDVHSHILPGIDDGASDMEETQEMLKIACSEGIREIIATPHFFSPHRHASPEKIARVLAQVQDKLEEWAIPIKLYAGNEIFYRTGIPDLLEAGGVLTLAGSRYVLVEFDPPVEYTYLRDGIIKLMSYDYLPIIAHAERYDCFFQERKRLHRIKEHGALLQVNGETLLGSFMDEMSQRGKYMVKQDLVDFLATDAHGSMGRSPRLQKSAAYLYKKLGREKAEKILFENPQAVIQNQPID